MDVLLWWLIKKETPTVYYYDNYSKRTFRDFHFDKNKWKIIEFFKIKINTWLYGCHIPIQMVNGDDTHIYIWEHNFLRFLFMTI